MAKWLLAYVITLIIFPRIKPYFKDIIDNEYVIDIGSWNNNFCNYCNIFSINDNKGISKAVRLLGNRQFRYCIWILFWIY